MKVCRQELRFKNKTCARAELEHVRIEILVSRVELWY